MILNEKCAVLGVVLVVFGGFGVFGSPLHEKLYESESLQDDSYMHRHIHHKRDTGDQTSSPKKYKKEEETADYWTDQAQFTLSEQLGKHRIEGIAKNVILFMGDGMSIATLAATRAYAGQKMNRTGEELKLSFERFPYVGLSKTYCVDNQVADSACSATAYLCGVKANEATIGVTASVPLSNCKAMQNVNNHVYSIARWSQLMGKRTGFVTTTRVTHASPAGTYAHTAHRDWESDTDVIKSGGGGIGNSPRLCPDIATQLIYGETGKHLNVIMGGGRKMFLPRDMVDEEGQNGTRTDGRNLIEEWKAIKYGFTNRYVSNRAQMFDVPENTDYMLGIYESDHMNYNLDRDPVQDPSLEEMTEKAIKLLRGKDNGFFLFVEGGRIDHGHHETKARHALEETLEFQKAVQRAVEMTNPSETLIVVTSDHAHTMTYSGYPFRGNDILGIAGKGEDGLPYTTLSYANGPGYKKEESGRRHNVSEDDLGDKNYTYPSLVPLPSETHGGDDVGIFARGPWAHLFTGVLEENVIPHIMAYASCVGDGITICDEIRKKRRK